MMASTIGFGEFMLSSKTFSLLSTELDESRLSESARLAGSLVDSLVEGKWYFLTSTNGHNSIGSWNPEKNTFISKSNISFPLSIVKEAVPLHQLLFLEQKKNPINIDRLKSFKIIVSLKKANNFILVNAEDLAIGFRNDDFAYAYAPS
ncbi:hypothetical protein A1QO_00765 [Vibrio genomosp. F10 str. ZF-129]|uniref:Uncharacterized protein n=1 Tax=Vibrio genomosp. F10 str. ZF-129 TaxID=1187848 RepID=A0A1E5BGC5_9VIBR|nr:hypothetical protein [Vibrio genomosp. F10]OEE35324.1 hypothetical protein A1QO_00765 [Vibrio genomosp. F10 str. ZF-129]